MTGLPKQRGRGGWWFLAAVLALYAVIALGDPQGANQALAFFGRVMRQLLPVLGLVFALLFVADLLLDEKRIKRHLGRESGVTGWLATLIGGVLSVGPVYAWYALLAEMRAKGMRDALVTAFLYSRALKVHCCR
ncbi:MAG TPA: permease [Thioalkalivibrio sp.]|nr:permease [Thioalkalivibrio sp.]